MGLAAHLGLLAFTSTKGGPRAGPRLPPGGNVGTAILVPLLVPHFDVRAFTSKFRPASGKSAGVLLGTTRKAARK